MTQNTSTVSEPSPGAATATRALSMSTFAFTVCFAVWTIFSIIGVQIKKELGLSETQFGLLIGTPVLTGSLVRMVLGVWTDRLGGRLVYTTTMLAAAAATLLLAFASTYTEMLIAALGVGLAGGSFAVGVAYVSRFYPAERQGTALGIFGVGNVGAAVTKLLGPLALVAWGWNSVALIWAGALALTALIFWFTTGDDPVIRARRIKGGATPRAFAAEFAPLKDARVWRFAFYYFFAFGAFVALSLWLPRYLIGLYGFEIAAAGAIAGCYSIPASVFRAYGGVLSDKYGARGVLYTMFLVATGVTLLLALPPNTHEATGAAVGPVPFVALVFILGFVMSLGKAAVFKHIPAYYPNNVGAVGGGVGMIGGLGGFILPIVFGALFDLTGAWSSCFALLFVISASGLAWMHVAIRRMQSAEDTGHPLAVAAK